MDPSYFLHGSHPTSLVKLILLGPRFAPRHHLARHKQVIEELKHIYMTKIRPVEERYKFDEFYSPLLNPVDFDAPPMVLMMGQYSVGKTSFIRLVTSR